MSGPAVFTYNVMPESNVELFVDNCGYLILELNHPQGWQMLLAGELTVATKGISDRQQSPWPPHHDLAHE